MAKRSRRTRWGFSEPSEEDRKRLRATSQTLGTPDYGVLTRASRSDMETRRDALKSVTGDLNIEKDSPAGRVFPTVTAAVLSHGTAAPGRGQYTGELIRPPEDPEKLGDAKGDLTSSQESAVRKSVMDELKARTTAARDGIAYTGGAAEEQSGRADSYWAGVKKHLQNITDYGADPEKGQPGRKMTDEEIEAKLAEMKADHARTVSGELAPAREGQVVRTFAPGVGGYVVPGQPKPDEKKPDGGTPGQDETAAKPGTTGDENPPAPDDTAEATFGAKNPDDDEDETHADEKGGRTSAPPSASSPAEPPPEPVRQPAFDDPEEAAAAIASGADMPYIDLVDAAVAVAAPTKADGPDYDPESVFRGVLERRIESDIIGAMCAVRGLERTSADKYHGANARAVMQACGASEREYMLARDLADAGDPAGLLSMQMKFMDSF